MVLKPIFEVCKFIIKLALYFINQFNRTMNISYRVSLYCLLLCLFFGCADEKDELSPEFQEVLSKVDISDDQRLTDVLSQLDVGQSNKRISNASTFETSLGTLQLDQIIERLSSPDQAGSN